MNIAFNVKYLIDVVRYIDAEQIEIQPEQRRKPVHHQSGRQFGLYSSGAAGQNERDELISKIIYRGVC